MRDIWAQTFGCEDIWGRDIWAQTFGCEDIWARNALQRTFYNHLSTFFFYFYICNRAGVLIFSNFLPTTSNMRTNQLMYIYGNLSKKNYVVKVKVTNKRRHISMFI